MAIATKEIEKATPEQIKAMGALVSKLGIRDKDAMVLGFTDMRTTSRAEMSKREAASMIRHLKQQDATEDSDERMRKYMFALTYEAAGLGRNASAGQKQNAKDKLNGWCVKFGIYHKPLDQLNHKELTETVTQYKKVYKSVLSNI